MSLTDFTQNKNNREYIDALFDKPTFPYSAKTAPLAPRIAPEPNQARGVGTAFDYLLRIYLSREFPAFNKSHSANSYYQNFPCCAEHVSTSAKRCEFLHTWQNRRLTYHDIMEMIPDCQILARLEAEFRSGRPFDDSEVFRIRPEDTEDLTNLIRLVKPNTFKVTRQLILNPYFGLSSQTVGGADADLIIDGTLIDIKTVSALEFSRESFRQLIGYWFINKREGDLYGEISHLGVYYSRFGVLFTFPVPTPHDNAYIHKPTGEPLRAWDVMETLLKIYSKVEVTND